MVSGSGRAGVKAAGRRLLDLVLPPLCLSCRTVVGEPGALCPACFGAVNFIAPPYCATCGTPFADGEAEVAICAPCSIETRPYGRSRAAFLYDKGSRGLVLGFKHADRTEATPAFVRWLSRAGQDLLAEAEVLVPVPLHRRRLFLRRYNQAALLARGLAGVQPGVVFAPDALIRVRRTQSQGGFDRTGRARNVRGAFAVRRPQSVEGKAVMLIDDVLTTGATVAECARVLRAAGAKSVDVLTLALVPPGQPAGHD